MTLGPCLGQVLPHLEVCTTTADDDCSGAAAPCTDVPAWGGSFGNGKNLPLGLAVDAFGDAIVAVQSNGTDVGTGPIDDTLDFGQGQPLTAGGTYDTFVARVSP